VAVEGGAVELRQAVDLSDVAVDAVADGDVDEAVIRAQRHCRLGTLLGKGVQACAGATTENDAQHRLWA
jgi:hypothetical protein